MTSLTNAAAAANEPARLDALTDHDKYRHAAEAAGGRLLLRPLKDNGRVDRLAKDLVAFEEATEPLEEHDPQRLVLIIEGVAACDPSTVFRVTFEPGFASGVSISQIAGPSEDKGVGRALIARDLCVREPDAFVEALREAAPAAANDNEPASPVELRYPEPPAKSEPWSPASAGGLIGDVAKWITSTAIIPNPELSLASAIALFAGMFGEKALGPTGTGANIYAVTLMKTAGGKGHPPKAMSALAELVGRAGAVTNGDPTSYAALERMLRRNRSTALVMDEFGITLADVNSPRANSAAAGIRKFCLAVYDQANGSFSGRAYASAETKGDDSPIVGPAFTILAMTTPETLYAALSESSISDGFLNRFVFVEGTPPASISAPPLRSDARPPRALVEALQAAYKAFPQPDVGGMREALIAKHVVPFDGGEGSAAHEAWNAVFLWEKGNAWDAVVAGLNGRAAENTLRLATLRAISRAPSAPAVTVEDVTWGFAIVRNSLETITHGAERHMAASPAEALRKAIVAALRDAGGELALSHLLQRRGVKGSDSRAVGDALRWLADCGEVIDAAGRPVPGRGSRLRLVVVP